MKTFVEWLELREISSNLLNRAADAAAARGDMKGDRLQSKFLQGSENAAERAKGLPRGRSWTSGDVANHPNARLIPDYSGIKYFFRGEGGKTEEGSFVVRNIEYKDWSSFVRKERAAAWLRTHGDGGRGEYHKPDGVTGRMPDFREYYVITTTKGEKVTVDGMAEDATSWQMGEEPTQKNWSNSLQVKLNGKEIFPDRKGAVELARQINKFDYEQIQANASGYELRSKPNTAFDFKGIKPEFIKQG